MSTRRGPVDLAALSSALFEKAGDYVMVLELDPAGDLFIVEANAAALAKHGYSRDELIGQPLRVIDPFTEGTSGEYLANLQNGQTITMEVKHLCKDGSSFVAEAQVTLVSLGDRRLAVAIERDITRRKQSQARQEHLDRLMRYVIEHARSAIAVHDLELRYVYVSDSYLRQFNVRDSDVIGKRHYDVFPDLPQKWREVHQRALRGEVCSAESDPYERADGTVEWTRWECRPWYEPDGSVGGIIVYTEVITDQVNAEKLRGELERQLQQARKMEAIGRLAGGVAHDFNNLLTGILGNASLVLADLPDGSPHAEPLREVADAAESAASLTRQLLAFSRRQIIEPKVIDLNELLRNLTKMLQRLIGEDVTLSTVLADGLLSVNVDPGQFEQVVLNLSINARDAMPGGGRLLVQTTNVEIDGEYAASHPGLSPGPHVMLSISDTGCGMTEEVKRHLFEPFFTTKTLGRGTGLGLATVFGIVKQAGGSIEVYSEAGTGTTFRVYVPAVARQADRLRETPGDASLPRGRERILFVEDDVMVRRLGARILRTLGYEVIEADGGAAALAQMDRGTGRIDLLMTDVVMPGMNGRELARLVTSRHPGVFVLYASGYTENVIVHHGIIDADVHFIHKPYTPTTLARKIRGILDGGASAPA